MMTQKAAVYQAVTSVLKEHGVRFEDGMDIKPILTKEMRAEVNAILISGFQAKKIELGTEFDETELKSYVSGLQSNWVRKDPRFNGNTKYEAKNPGSRAGSGDQQLKALRALLSQVTTATEKAEVQTFIDQRVSELNAAKAPKIDVSALPEGLRKFVK